MSYPFILTTNGDVIARINHDGTWSVRWDCVSEVAYEKPQPSRLAVVATAKLLLAAKDNFLLTSWAESETMIEQWTHYEARIGDGDGDDPISDDAYCAISYNGDMLARVNRDGSWSVNWEPMMELGRMPICEFRAVALIGICRLFIAAKDRFWTTPWPIEEDDE